MAQPRLRAEFFVSPGGTAIPKAPPLKRSVSHSVYLESNKRCEKCGERVMFGGRNADPYMPIASGHIDHILPRSRGGQNDRANLRLLCMSCNCAKGAK